MKILKWVAYLIVSLILIILVILASVYVISENHRKQTYDISVEALSIPIGNGDAIANGRHVAAIRGCIECHGANLGGRIFIEDPMVGLLVATNLTAGENGLGSTYSDEDFIRAIRHGVRKDGKSVIFMPSHEYTEIDKKDLADLVAYLRSLPPADSYLPETKIGLPFRAMYVLGGEIHLFPAMLINHEASVPEPVEDRTPIELGKYVSATCIGCHGGNFAGGTIPGVPPHWPQASNLTPKGPLSSYTEEDFIIAMRRGITPDGRELVNEFMPWGVFGQMTDDELEGLFVYLQSLTPHETGDR